MRLKWTYETCIEESKKYKTKVEFRKNNSSAYNVSLKNGWLDEMIWLKSLRKSNNYWTYETCIEESKKYKSRSEFEKKSSTAYIKSCKNGWLDEMTWLKPKNNDFLYFVYIYKDDVNKIAYIGLTRDKKRRHRDHKLGTYNGKNNNSPVYRYFKSINKDIPEPIYLEEKLNMLDARKKEHEWIQEYKNKGYNLLNKGKTGEFTGSVGGININWTKKKVFEESKKYKLRREFKINSTTAYNVAYKNGWLDEMTWLEYMVHKRYTKEEVFEESKRYTSKSEFQKNNDSAYTNALRNGWLDEMTWLKPKYNNWTKERVFEESKKYKTRGEMQKDNRNLYDAAYKNGWLDEMTWLKVPFRWSKEKIVELLKDYETLSDFSKDYYGAYLYICRNNLENEIKIWLKNK